MKISKSEQETIITFDESNNLAHVYTFNKKLKKRLAQAKELFPNDVTFKSQNYDGHVSYLIPKKLVKISMPSKRQFTDEQREEIRERLKKTKELSKKSNNIDGQLPLVED